MNRHHICCLVISLWLFRYSFLVQSRFIEQFPRLQAKDDNITLNERFGRSVAISGRTLVIGAYYDDDNGVQSGSAYIFVWDGSTFVQRQKLLPSDGATGDRFGFSVAMNGDTIIVGAYRLNAGSVYVFRWNGTDWTQQETLTASDGMTGDYFGYSVAMNNDTMVLGAPLTDDKGVNSGAAYVFKWNGSNWVQRQKLLASDGKAGDSFGTSVAVCDATMVVGAYLARGSNAGSAYIFRRNGSDWVQTQILIASDGQQNDWFGRSVAMDGDTLVVGAYHKNSLEGAVYVFGWNRTVGEWDFRQQLVASNRNFNHGFGFSISVSGVTIVVGAYGYNVSLANVGSAYIFRWNGLIFVETQMLTASDGAAGDLFGSVAVGADAMIVGAPGTDAVYVFSRGSCDLTPPMDLIFVLDSSSGSLNLQKEVEFSIALLNGSLDVFDDVRVATVKFAGALALPVVEFGFADAPTRMDGISRLEILNLTAVVDAQTWTDSALTAALGVFTNASGNAGRNRVIVMVTDGVPNPGATANTLEESPCASDGRVSNTVASLRSRSMNVWVLVVAVTSNMTDVRARMGCLPSIDPTNATLLFGVSDYSLLTNVSLVNSMRNAICRLAEAPTYAPTHVPSRTPSSGSPTKSPTQMPSDQPTKTPTQTPSIQPTNPPSQSPTQATSQSPTNGTKLFVFCILSSLFFL